MDSSVYKILYDGKVVLVKHDFLMQYLDYGRITLYCVLDNGSMQQIYVDFYEGLPEDISLKDYGME